MGGRCQAQLVGDQRWMIGGDGWPVREVHHARTPRPGSGSHETANAAGAADADIAAEPFASLRRGLTRVCLWFSFSQQRLADLSRRRERAGMLIARSPIWTGGTLMDDATAFLGHVIPRLREEVVALENCDARPRKGLWSHHDPVTLFGAEASASSWEQVEPIFDRLAESFSQGQSCTYDVLGAGVSGDLGYVVAIERSVAGTHGSPPQTFTLRVTTIFSREQGDWKVIHRHGGPYDITSREALKRRANRSWIPGPILF